MQLKQVFISPKYLARAMSELLTFARITQDGEEWEPTEDPPDLDYFSICLGTILKSCAELKIYSNEEIKKSLECMVMNFEARPEGPKRKIEEK